jgi:hypothetical protein
MRTFLAKRFSGFVAPSVSAGITEATKLFVHWRARGQLENAS